VRIPATPGAPLAAVKARDHTATLPANEDVAHVGDEALGGRRGERRRRL
jgi:hypothetical protein